MKKVKFLALMFLAGATMFTSCKKDETTMAEPTISFANGLSTFEIDYATMADPYTVTITPTIAAEGEIKTFTVKKKDALGASSTVAITGSFSGKTSFTETFNISFASADDFPIQIIFNVTDKEDMGIEKIFTVTKKTASANTPFALTKTGQFYHIAGLLQGAYDLDGDAGVSSGGTASTKSMKNTDIAGNAFTGTWSSDAANGTQYVKTTTAYADIYQENAVTLYTAGSASATVTNPLANDVYIAKKGSTYYVIKITTVEPAFSTGTGGNTGRITFGYKKN